MHLVLNQVGQLHDADDPHGHWPIEGLAGLPVVEHHFSPGGDRLTCFRAYFFPTSGQRIVRQVISLVAKVLHPQTQAYLTGPDIGLRLLLDCALVTIEYKNLLGIISEVLQGLFEDTATSVLLVRHQSLGIIPVLPPPVTQIERAGFGIIAQLLEIHSLLTEPRPSAFTGPPPGPVNEPGPSQLRRDLFLVGAIEDWGHSLEAQAVYRPPRRVAK